MREKLIPETLEMLGVIGVSVGERKAVSGRRKAITEPGIVDQAPVFRFFDFFIWLSIAWA